MITFLVDSPLLPSLSQMKERRRMADLVDGASSIQFLLCENDGIISEKSNETSTRYIPVTPFLAVVSLIPRRRCRRCRCRSARSRDGACRSTSKTSRGPDGGPRRRGRGFPGTDGGRRRGGRGCRGRVQEQEEEEKEEGGWKRNTQVSSVLGIYLVLCALL